MLINQQQRQHHIFFMDVSELFSVPTPPPPPPHPTTTRCSRAICFLNSSYFFNASIITFSKKKNWEKNVTLDPRHGTLALDLEPSTLDLRQKDRLRRKMHKQLLIGAVLVVLIEE